MSDLLMPGIVLVGLVIGALLGWSMSRARGAAQVEAAVARAEMNLQAELVQMRERVRSGDELRKADQTNFDILKRQADGWRNDLDAARDESAKQSERASRVPTLEAELVSLADRLRASGAEVLRLSGDGAQKGQAVTSLGDQVSRLASSKEELEQRLEEVTSALNATSERKAGLAEQVARLPGLEEKLTEAARLGERLNTQLTALRESTGGEISRLKAELVAEREAHALVRTELPREKSARETAEAGVSRLNEELAETRAKFQAEQEAHQLVRGEALQEKQAREAADTEVVRLGGELTEANTRLETERQSATEKLAILLQAKEALTDQFKSLANDILEEKSKRFAEQNQVAIGQLLDPLKTQLTEFKGKVEEVYVQEGKDRSALSEQVRQLVGLNQALSQDAKNLTSALKGSSKAQGNWGELVLERVLEASGLRKDYEYHVQESQTRDDGTRAQPDVVINLPEDRRLVVDAKVSLVAYEEHMVAETDEARTQAVRRHLDSIRGHIKGLSGKEYQKLYGLKSLDFVLMFVPIEPAFMMAVTNDGTLFMDAWERNVLLVSPSTLLFVVRTVAHLWRQEAQSRNAQDIAKRGAELYDRLFDFVKDLESVGGKLRQAQDAYESAHKRLAVGKGNVIRQAEMLRDLGVKPTKSLPAPLVAIAASHEDPIAAGTLPNLAGSTEIQSVALGQ